MPKSHDYFIRSAADFGRLITLNVTPEGRYLEFKQEANGWPVPSGMPDPAKRKAQKELCRDVSQFANTDGGCLLVGVDEFTDATGLKVANGIKSVVQPDGLKAWMEQAIANFCVPRTFTYYVETIPIGGDIIVAVNVEPSFHTVYVWDKDNATIEVMVRTSHGKRGLNPDELERHIMNASRATHLAVEALATPNQPVMLASPVYQLRPETDLEYSARMRNQLGVTGWTGGSGGDNPNVPRRLAEQLDHNVACHVDSIDSRHLSVALYGRQLLAIPYGIIREVWEYSPGTPPTLGLLLDCEIVASAKGLVLRR